MTRVASRAACRTLETIVIGPVALTTCIGAISYLWLTAVMLPLSRGLRATSQGWSGDGWRSALPITLGIAALTAAIPAAAIVLHDDRPFNGVCP